MAVAAIKEYVGVPRDLVANFNGKQLVCASWDRHLLFAAPFLLCVRTGSASMNCSKPVRNRAFIRLMSSVSEPIYRTNAFKAI